MASYLTLIGHLKTELIALTQYYDLYDNNKQRSQAALNSMFVVAKGLYLPVEHNPEKQVLPTLNIKGTDPIAAYNALRGYLLENYRRTFRQDIYQEITASGTESLEGSVTTTVARISHPECVGEVTGDDLLTWSDPERGRVFQDPFKFVIMSEVLDTAGKFGLSFESSQPGKSVDDTVDATFDEKMKRHFNVMQLLYEHNPQEMLNEYVSILQELSKLLSEHQKTLANFTPKVARKVDPLSGQVGSYKHKTDLEFHQRSFEIEKYRLMRELVVAPEWPEAVGMVREFATQIGEGLFDKYRYFKIGSRGEIRPAKEFEVSTEEIIGCEEQVGQVRKALDLLVEGKPLPLVGLYGPPGVGKSMTVKALLQEVDDVKAIFIDANQLNHLEQIAKFCARKKQKTVIYVDELNSPYHVNWDIFNKFVDGVDSDPDLLKNVTVVYSTNVKHSLPYIGIPKNVKSRSEQVMYNFSFRRDRRQLVERLCNKYRIEDVQGTYRDVRRQIKRRPKRVWLTRGMECSPRAIERYVKQKAA